MRIDGECDLLRGLTYNSFTLNGEIKMKANMVSDWLSLHDVTPETVWPLQEAVNRRAGALFSDVAEEEYGPTGFSADEAWELVANATCAALPELIKNIENVRDSAERNFKASPNDTPFTRNRGKHKGTFVSLCYRRTCKDLLCMAHEFGHALQIDASNYAFTPPVHREIAAFISEMCFLEFIRENAPLLHRNLIMAWKVENEVYLGDNLDLLQKKLSDLSLPYDYRMNYPLARMIAFKLSESSLSDLPSCFSGKVDLSNFIALLSSSRENKSTQNHLSKKPQD